MAFFPNQPCERLPVIDGRAAYYTSVLQAYYEVRTDRVQSYTDGEEIIVDGGVSSAQSLETENQCSQVVIKDTNPPSLGDVLIATSATTAEWQTNPFGATAVAPFVTVNDEPNLANEYNFIPGNGTSLQDGGPASILSVGLPNIGSIVPDTLLVPDLSLDAWGKVIGFDNPYTNGPDAFVPSFSMISGVDSIAVNTSHVYVEKNGRSFALRLVLTTDGTVPGPVEFTIDNMDIDPAQYPIVGSAVLTVNGDASVNRGIGVVITPNGGNALVRISGTQLDPATDYPLYIQISLPPPFVP